MSTEKLIVLGAGGHAKVVIATARAAGFEVVAVYDDDAGRIGTELHGVPVRGPMSAAASHPSGRAVIAVGDNRVRQQLATQLQLDAVSVVHPSAVVHESVVLGPGAVVFAGCVVQPDTRIGEHAILNTGATVDHDCHVGAFAHLAPGSHLAGGVTIGPGALLGVGVSAIPNVSVGEWAVVGAGAVITGPIAGHVTATGVPARVRQAP